jgi:DNA invertase Pin-like site-specific DNA recombinase
MANSTKRAASYGRVSADGQTTDIQIVALREVAARRGWDIAEVYLDNGISGPPASEPGAFRARVRA